MKFCWRICKNWNNWNTKWFSEKQILPSSFAVFKNMSSSQVSTSITVLNMVFQITSFSIDPDFAYTSIISSTAVWAVVSIHIMYRIEIDISRRIDYQIISNLNELTINGWIKKMNITCISDFEYSASNSNWMKKNFRNVEIFML